MTERNSFKKWYDQNKEDFNKKRRDRYAKDEEMRQKVVEKQRKYRAEHPNLSARTTSRYPDAVRIGDAAKTAGCSVQSIRAWEKNGLIPKPTHVGVHRYYTSKQVALLRGFAEVLAEVRYKPDIWEQAIAKCSAEIFLKWES